MKILIIGASGFIGHACFSYFSSAGYTTWGFDRSGSGSERFITGSEFVVLPEMIRQKFDVILNCAGSSNIPGSFSDPGTDFQSNVVLVQYILEQIKISAPDTKFINLSSAAVYGNPAKLPIAETAATAPLSPYGFHKLLSETLLQQYALFFNIKVSSVRIFSAYGPGLKRQFFYDLYSKFNSGNQNIELAGTGKESRDFIFISDITEALEILIKKGTFNGEVYNLASQTESFIESTSRLFADICNFKGKINFSGQSFPGYPINWKGDIHKIKTLGFSPRVSLKEGLTEYYDWLKISSTCESE